MPATLSQIMVVPPTIPGVSGYVDTTVSITSTTGASAVAYTTLDGSTAFTFPATVSSPTTFYLPYTGTFTVSALIGSQQVATTAYTAATVSAINSAAAVVVECAAPRDNQEELSSRYGLLNTVALIGDSITAANAQTGTTPSFARGANGWFWHANAALGDAMTLSANYAVSGKRADEVLSGQVPQVLAMSPLPKFCIVLAGSNDLTASATAATVKTRLLAIYDALNAVGITVIAGCITPRSSYTASIASINRYIKELAGSRRLFMAVDWATPMSDSTGAPASGMLYDGLHPGGSGASVMGATLASVLSGKLLPVDHFPYPGDATNLLANPFQTGTSGTKGTGVTGNVSTSWTLERGTGTPTVVGAKVARTDGIPGEWMQVTATETAGGDYVNLRADVTTTGFAVGDRLQFAMEIQTDTQTSYPYLWLQFNSVQQNASAGGGMSHLSLAPGDSYATWARMPGTAIWVSQPWTVPVGTTLPFSSMTLYLRILKLTGNAIRVGRCGFFNLGA